MNAFFTYGIIAINAVAIAETSQGKPFLSFRADLVSKSGVKTRTVTVFNTEAQPNLVAEAVAALNDGPVNATVLFDAVGEFGESARMVAFAPGKKMKAVNDDEPQLPLEAVAEAPAAVEVAAKPARKARAKKAA